jgi:hypothetical protein
MQSVSFQRKAWYYFFPELIVYTRILCSSNRVNHMLCYNHFIILFRILNTGNIVTVLIYALPDNSSVNTVQYATLDETGFSMSSAPRPVLVTDQWTSSLKHDVCFLCSLPHATTEGLCFLCVVRAERICENTGMGIDFAWVPKLQGNSNVARRRIRRLSVWRYICCRTLILGVCNLVKML